MMIRYLAILSYDGTNYNGFQRQENTKNTIQEIIEDALKKIFEREIKIFAAGRTDKGVHAFGQVFHFDLDFEIDVLNIKNKLNLILSTGIKIIKLKKTKKRFHARFDAKYRIYEYHIAKSESNILKERFECYVDKFDINLVKPFLYKFIGIKNFKIFSKKDDTKIPIKVLYYIKVKESSNKYIFEFKGNGFLRGMVRKIMGLIIKIGIGEEKGEIIDYLFDVKSQKISLHSAPAKGLFLKKVIY